jgi:hypothetical protein
MPFGIAAMIAVAPATSAASQPSARPAQSSSGARLELIGQRLAVDPNGDIELRYLLTGLSAGDPLQLLPPPAPPEPPVTDPSVPPGSEPVTLPEPAPPAPPLPALTLLVTNYPPLTNADDVARVVGSDVDPNVFDSIGGDAVDGVAIDARPLLTLNDDSTVSLALDIETDVVDSIGTRLKLDRPGIYPLRVQLLIDDGTDNVIATAGTVVQRVAGAIDGDVDTPPPIDLAVITVTPDPAPDANEATLDAARARLDDGIELAATITSPVTLEVPPTLIAEETETTEGANRLSAALADDELVALPIVPLDVSSAVAAGQAEAYTRLLGAGEDLLTDSLPTTASRRDIWITTDPLSAGGAQHLRDLGTRFVVIPAELYQESIDDELPPTDLFVRAELPDGGTLPFLVVDPLASQLTPVAADLTLAQSTAAEWAVTTAAQLLVEQADDDTAANSPTDRPASPPRRSRVLTTPDLSSPDARLIQALESLVATTPAIRFTAASALVGLTDDLLDADDEPVTIQLPATAGPLLDARVELLDLTRLELTSAASMLPDDDPRVTDWWSQLDIMISTGYSDEQAQAMADELLAEASTFTRAVELPDPFRFTLTGRSGTIEVRLRNTLDEPLDVIVSLDSTKVTFPDGDQLVTLRPLDETSVNVPVEAEANGTSSINLVVSTPAGTPIADPVTLTARVTALTGLGQVLTGGLVVVLLTWWFTHWRSRRRAELAVDGRDRHPSTRTVESGEL